jgi:hypothetical protein
MFADSDGRYRQGSDDLVEPNDFSVENGTILAKLDA